MTTKKLTPKEAMFVHEYLVDMNAAGAARRAGYSARTANVIGHEIMGKPHVAAAIADAMAERAKRVEITGDMVLQELAKLAFSNMGDFLSVTSGGDPYFDLSKLTREQSAALTEVTVEDFKEGRGEDARDVRRIKIKLADKRAALVDTGKAIGMKGFKNLIGEDPENPFQRTDDATAAARVAALLEEARRRRDATDAS